MSDEINWSLTTWEGSRRAQHRKFLALSFRERLEVMEQSGEVMTLFARLPSLADQRRSEPGVAARIVARSSPAAGR